MSYAQENVTSCDHNIIFFYTLAEMLIQFLCFILVDRGMILKEETSDGSTKVEDAEDNGNLLYYEQHLTNTVVTNPQRFNTTSIRACQRDLEPVALIFHPHNLFLRLLSYGTLLQRPQSD